MEHLENDKLALKKISRLTKKNSFLMLTVPSYNAPLIKFGVIREFDIKSGHLRSYTKEKIQKLLKEVGFEIIYSQKSEGILRNSLFIFKFGNFITRLANRFSVLSDIITALENIVLKVFGESQLIFVAKKV